MFPLRSLISLFQQFYRRHVFFLAIVLLAFIYVTLIYLEARTRVSKFLAQKLAYPALQMVNLSKKNCQFFGPHKSKYQTCQKESLNRELLVLADLIKIINSNDAFKAVAKILISRLWGWGFKIRDKNFRRTCYNNLHPTHICFCLSQVKNFRKSAFFEIPCHSNVISGKNSRHSPLREKYRKHLDLV